jgi:hypothetical protein
LPEATAIGWKFPFIFHSYQMNIPWIFHEVAMLWLPEGIIVYSHGCG